MEPKRLRPSQRKDNKLTPFVASAYIKSESSTWKHLKESTNRARWAASSRTTRTSLSATRSHPAELSAGVSCQLSQS